MASFPFESLQPKELHSMALCKYPSTLISFKSHFCSNFFSVSTRKQTFHQDFSSVFVVRANVSNMDAKLSGRRHSHSSKTISSIAQRQMGYGFKTLKSSDKRVERKSMKATVSSVMEEKTERRFGKSNYNRKDRVSRTKQEMGSQFSSFKPKDERRGEKYKENKSNVLVDKKEAENSKQSKGTSQVGEEKTAGKSNKSEDDSSQIPLRVELDMCSKRGDVLGAISLYDSAQKDGIKLGLYHYTVLLYLCSSAAVGVIRPAKSGSGSRSFKKLNLISELSSANSVVLNEIGEKGNGSFDSTKLSFDESGNSSGASSDKLASSSSEFLVGLVGGKATEPNSLFSDGFTMSNESESDSVRERDNQQDCEIRVSGNVKKYALRRGFEIYEKMRLENVPLNEAALTAVARMAMSMGNGDLAFEMVKQMKPLGINPRLRSYGPALFSFCSSGDIEKAFTVEEHMLKHGVYPEEPELEALLRLSVNAGRSDKVYYLLHKLRTSVRQVSPPTADLIERWFKSKEASRIGRRKWDKKSITDAIENGGGGWHGQGWLGKGKWTVNRTFVRDDGVCKGCEEKLTTIDLDPIETENFAKSVASIAAKRERNSSFQKFQKWLDYYGPFEAVVDAANVGLFSQRKFSLSKVNAVVNGIRQILPSKKWPLIVVHNKRITGDRMDQPTNRTLIEKWKNADALYATPTGSNDDWYWLYAAIKFKCLIVTNDEMRDHIFQLLGNDFFPKWKERHHESEKGHWHIPIASEHDSTGERTWLCIKRAGMHMRKQGSSTRPKEANTPRLSKGGAKVDVRTKSPVKLPTLDHCSDETFHGNSKLPPEEIYRNLRNILATSLSPNDNTILSQIEAAEKLGGCSIDFQI
ncbi:PREDICTED: proteinaceous RNase P 1, chloroplastic/mitochondrial-like isoform X2 [Nelumbo nucifera]|uniref:ribonuclease P n=1 Tax=Nelumbo nucifera TaxID=4432 RepID=A0A1U7ZMC6_NELNU|nr:PREDICTED: proteinaceous RNase P 1, chloroplastic/mitochondrial-like isoform X2 [Nelumbo nucifera]